ncbi:hypothetical protein CBL_20538 [Carabus blaptoides fortunei]
MAAGQKLESNTKALHNLPVVAHVLLKIRQYKPTLCPVQLKIWKIHGHKSSRSFFRPVVLAIHGISIFQKNETKEIKDLRFAQGYLVLGPGIAGPARRRVSRTTGEPSIACEI